MKPARSIHEHYPSFEDAGPFFDAPESWLGRISPFGRCSASDLACVIDDLRAGCGVCLQEGGLLHDPGCHRDHAAVPFLSALTDLTRDTFALRLVVPMRPIHPKVIAIYPEISSAAFPEHPHLFRTAVRDNPELRRFNPKLHQRVTFSELPKMMPDALCTYRPGDGEWSWDTGDLVDCLDFAALFVAKHAIWVRTGANDRALWIGPQASHEAVDMLQELDPDGECRCGGGRRYRDCHRGHDEAHAAVMAQITRRVVRPAA